MNKKKIRFIKPRVNRAGEAKGQFVVDGGEVEFNVAQVTALITCIDNQEEIAEFEKALRHMKLAEEKRYKSTSAKNLTEVPKQTHMTLN